MGEGVLPNKGQVCGCGGGAVCSFVQQVDGGGDKPGQAPAVRDRWALSAAPIRAVGGCAPRKRSVLHAHAVCAIWQPQLPGGLLPLLYAARSVDTHTLSLSSLSSARTHAHMIYIYIYMQCLSYLRTDPHTTRSVLARHAAIDRHRGFL